MKMRKIILLTGVVAAVIAMLITTEAKGARKFKVKHTNK